MVEAHTASFPDHVRAEQVYDFDIWTDEQAQHDPHAAYRRVQRDAPEVFYTPRNGGHWVATRYDVISEVHRDVEHFSSANMTVPKIDTPFKMIPLHLDPPDHGQYRAVLVRYLSSGAIAAMEPAIRGWAERLIAPLVAGGGTEFVEGAGSAFPVSIFMELMGLPFDRFEEFRSAVVEYFGQVTPDRQIAIETYINTELTALIEARQRAPQDDLISRLIAEEVRGRQLTMVELQSICFLLFVAGLDTVANSLSFAFLHLARDPALQSRLVADPGAIPAFVEETLRRYAIINGGRVVRKAVSFHGAKLQPGEMMVTMISVAGLDEAVNEDPERFDIDRPKKAHHAFAIGPHMCAGHYLARAEMRVFVEEWLKHVPAFATAADFRPDYRSGHVNALRALPLRWPAGR